VRSAFPKPKINTRATQSGPTAHVPSALAGKQRKGQRPQGRLNGGTRESVRGDGRRVIEMDHGITVYPPAEDGEPWRAVFPENGQRRHRQAGTELGAGDWMLTQPRAPTAKLMPNLRAASSPSSALAGPCGRGGVHHLLHVRDRDVLAGDGCDDRGDEPLAQPHLSMGVLVGPLPDRATRRCLNSR
jgi:hypothetical protein